MLIGYARVSKTDGSQVLDLQRDALLKAGVAATRIYQDEASGKRDGRPGLVACLKALRKGDVLVVWKLDRLGRDLRHLVNTAQDLADHRIGLKVLAGQGAEIDTTTAGGKLIFGIFAALAEFERELIRERARAGLAAARARGRKGGRRFDLTKAQFGSPRRQCRIAIPRSASFAKNSVSPAQSSTAMLDQTVSCAIMAHAYWE
jgi:DNA invertase Pin-like site-specific DNA recombinase